MIHPIPPGTRDVLPDEMREQRAITDALRATFDDGGYGEVWTPALEYEEVVGRETAYRLFGDDGRVLALRSDMTLPIARVAATRFRDEPGPLRLCYFAHSYRPGGEAADQPTEFLQAGAELVGVEGPEGEAEVIGLLLGALDRAGLTRHRIGLGDSSLFRRVLEQWGVEAERRQGLLELLTARDLVGLERAIDGLGLPADARRVLVRLAQLRGGPQALEEAASLAGASLDGLRQLYSALEDQGLADRVILDLGLIRELDYYTGVVFEVYDPAVGFTLGGGGRYDDLVGRFGDPRAACGFGIDVQRLHLARAAEGGLG